MNFSSLLYNFSIRSLLIFSYYSVKKKYNFFGRSIVGPWKSPKIRNFDRVVIFSDCSVKNLKFEPPQNCPVAHKSCYNSNLLEYEKVRKDLTLIFHSR